MIRLSYNDARTLLVILASLSEAGDDDLHRVRREAARAIPEVAYFAEDAFYPDDIKDLLKNLIQQVSQPEDGSEGMLLDEIIRVLQLTTGRGALSKNTLIQLQSVALTQREMAELAAKIRENRMSCTQCGTELQYGEMLVGNWTAGSEHGVRCMRCAMPAIMRCSFSSERTGKRCDHPVRMSKKLATAIQNIRHYCENHEGGVEKETTASTPTPPTAQGVGDGDRIFFTQPQNLGEIRGLGEPGRVINTQAAPQQPPQVNWTARMRRLTEDLRQRVREGDGEAAAAPRYLDNEGVADGGADFGDLFEEGTEEEP